MKRLGILGMVAVVTLIAGDGTGSATAKDSPEQVQKASDIVVQTLQRETREGLQDRGADAATLADNYRGADAATFADNHRGADAATLAGVGYRPVSSLARATILRNSSR